MIKYRLTEAFVILDCQSNYFYMNSKILKNFFFFIPIRCKQLQYLKHLPTTSVIIIYHNEYLSVLLRTVHSVYNRTPHKLLHEILLINDGSTKGELYEQLFTYVQQNFDERVKIHNLPERRGLIVARMEGVRKSKGEVLMFMDAHMEVETNWLPPLLGK